MFQRLRLIAGSAMTVAVLAMLLPGVALAHEKRTVGEYAADVISTKTGTYSFIV